MITARAHAYVLRRHGFSPALVACTPCYGLQTRAASYLLHNSPIPTYFFQDSLPRLPIPPLTETCKKFVRSLAHDSQLIIRATSNQLIWHTSHFNYATSRAATFPRVLVIGTSNLSSRCCLMPSAPRRAAQWLISSRVPAPHCSRSSSHPTRPIRIRATSRRCGTRCIWRTAAHCP